MGATLDTYIQDLHKLANNCEYGSLRDELIRYRIIVGVLDDSLSDQLQSKSNLTLAQVIQLSRQAEARVQNWDIVQGRKQTIPALVHPK